MRVAIVDDYLDCALDVADWSRVADRADITVFTDPFADAAETIDALRHFDFMVV